MVSVIVPVYNCEQYLKESINSLIDQTIFNQLEIIFVNDGSTDDSELILQSYVNTFSNMKLYSQSNKGASAARNVGIRNCSGEYVCFFDADDIAKPTLYEKLLELVIIFDVDMAIVDYSMVFPDGFEKKHRDSVAKILMEKEEIMKEFFAGSLICTNPIDKIFKKELLKTVFFPEGYSVGEDMFFVYQILKKINKLAIDSTESLYRYRLRPDSIMKKEFSDKHIDSVRLSRRILDEIDEMDTIYLYAEANYVHEICKMLALYMKDGSSREYESIMNNQRKKIKKYSLCNAWKYMNKKSFVALFLMKKSPKVYLWLYRILRIG